MAGLVVGLLPVSRPRGATLRRLELSAAFADDLAASEMRDGSLFIVSAGEAEGWMENDGEISILNADRRTMTRASVAAVRQTMTGPPVDLADFLPASPFPGDFGFKRLHTVLLVSGVTPHRGLGHTP